MQQLIARLRAEHQAMESDLCTLQLRVARRPVSRLALVDILNLLDTRLLPHDRLEETHLFPQLDAPPPESAGNDHERIAADRARLREGLAGWTKRRVPDPSELDELACMAEDLIVCILQHFQVEERQVFRPFEHPDELPAEAPLAIAAMQAGT